MTALPLRLNTMRRRIAAIAVLLLAFGGTAHADDPVAGDAKVFTDSGFARLVFRFDEEVPAKIDVNFPILVVTFKKPVAVSVDRLNERAPDFISAARIDPDGKAIRIALNRQVRVHSIPAAERLYVDLLPEPWAGVTPGLPQEVIAELASRLRDAERRLHRQHLAVRAQKPPTIRVKAASQPTFTRFVFVMPDNTNVVPDRHDDKLTLSFDRPIKWDLADALAIMPPTLSAITSEIADDQVVVNFKLNGMPVVRTFREDRSIAVDIGSDGAAEKHAAAQPAAAALAAADAGAPAITPPQTVPAKDEASGAQADEPPPLIDVPAPPEKAAAESHAKPRAELKFLSPAKAAAAPAAEPVKKAMAEAPRPVAPPPAPKADAPKLAPAEHLAAKPDTHQSAAPKAVAPKAAAPKAEPAKPMPPKSASHEPAPAKAAAPAGDAQAAKAEAEPEAKSDAKSEAKVEPPTPAPDPNAPVAAEPHRDGDALRIDFPFAAPTPAAVFLRGHTAWLVFDSAARVDLAAFAREPDSGVREARFARAKDGAGIVRLTLARPRLLSAMMDGSTWTVTIADKVVAPTKPLAVARTILGKERASIVIPFEHASATHRLADGADGAKLMVVTALGPVRGILRPQSFVELRALPSTQGVVLEPLADDLTAELAADKITIGRPGGLSLSPTVIGQEHLETNFRALTFDTQLWGFNRQANYNARQSELIRLAAMAPPPKRRKARFDLARFYLARGMSAEAIGVLNVALADGGGDDVTGTVLKAVANVMLGRPDNALKNLSDPRVGNQLDASVWRALAYAHEGKWAEAHERFKELDTALAGLPIELQRLALREKLHADIEVGDFDGANREVNEFETIGVPAPMQPAIAVLVGRLYQGLGRNEDALTNYRAAAASSDQSAAAQGQLRETMLRYAMRDMPPKEVIDKLETLTTVWRGDETEAEGLKLLAHLYTEDGRYREAFHVMKAATLAHPNSDLTRKIQDEAAATFEALFLGGKADALPPIKALALFYDYRELTPVGRRGDEMIRKLADRLVAVDLLDQAAELLQHQVDKRLQGAARAQVATRLATIYLTNRKPERALAALRASRTDGLSNELRDQRLLLEARALSETGRYDIALEMIGNIEGRQAVRLRADILWAAKRWRQAAEQIELLYGERWKQFAPLLPNERIDILRAAIGYALADEPIGLARLREKYAAKMAETPDRHAFDVVSAPTGTSGKEFKTVAGMIAGADTLDGFLQEMRARYPDFAAQPEQGADKGAPADSPAPAKRAPGKVSSAAPVKDAGGGKDKRDPQTKPAANQNLDGETLKPSPATTGSIRGLPASQR